MKERTDHALLGIALFAVAKLIFHTIANQHYGFHRDELATLDDARHLAWGYVAYPPLTPFLGRVALTLFGESLAGFRFFAAAGQSLAIVLTASIARHLGGNRAAQWIAALAVAIAPVSLAGSSLMQYFAFDYLWWVVIGWLVVQLVQRDDPRFWVPIGACIGLGVLTRYTILFLVAGIVVGFFATPLRVHLRSRWLWIGVATSLVVAAPNLIWQMRHDFITLEFLEHIHARDVRIGRADDFLLHQLFIPANAVTIPLWSAGLVALFASPAFRRFRIAGWMAMVPFALFLVAHGRDYYAAPLYPMLFAAGATWWMGVVGSRKWIVVAVVSIFLAAGALVAAFVTPVAPIGSSWWRRAVEMNGDLGEEVGWPELVGEVARVRDAIPPQERARTAIYCSNYGEAGAVSLYGRRHGLPPPISGVNSFWARGYGNPPPEAVIVVGGRRESWERRFESVELAGRLPNTWRIDNEESEKPEIYLCRRVRGSWPALWTRIRGFG